MKQVFERSINGKLYLFSRVEYPTALAYYVHFNCDSKTEIFRMNSDENGGWKIQPQVLPGFVLSSVKEINNIIIENETKGNTVKSEY